LFRTGLLLIDSPMVPLGAAVSAVVKMRFRSRVGPLAGRKGLSVLSRRNSSAGGDAPFLLMPGVSLCHKLPLVVSLFDHKLLEASK
jgi:hypothetical protein